MVNGILGVASRIIGIFLVKAIVVIYLVKAIFPVICKFAVDMSYFEHVTFWTMSYFFEWPMFCQKCRFVYVLATFRRPIGPVFSKGHAKFC